MSRLTERPLEPSRLYDEVRSPRAGAVVLFVGTAREVTDGRRTSWLEYASYAEMAERKLAELEAEARRRWPLVGCSTRHRLGRLEPGEVSVVVAVSAPHRGDAFEAGQWLIDTIKKVVPIWKQEHWDDGTSEWVHPGLEIPVQQRGSR